MVPPPAPGSSRSCLPRAAGDLAEHGAIGISFGAVYSHTPAAARPRQGRQTRRRPIARSHPLSSIVQTMEDAADVAVSERLGRFHRRAVCRAPLRSTDRSASSANVLHADAPLLIALTSSSQNPLRRVLAIPHTETAECPLANLSNAVQRRYRLLTMMRCLFTPMKARWVRDAGLALGATILRAANACSVKGSSAIILRTVIFDHVAPSPLAIHGRAATPPSRAPYLTCSFLVPTTDPPPAAGSAILSPQFRESVRSGPTSTRCRLTNGPRLRYGCGHRWAHSRSRLPFASTTTRLEGTD